MWKNPLTHRLAELEALRLALKEEVEAFRADDELRKTEAENEIFSELLKIANHLGVISDRVISDSLFLEVSTVARWRNSGVSPPKRKQIQILEMILAHTNEAGRKLKKDIETLKEKMDEVKRHRKELA